MMCLLQSLQNILNRVVCTQLLQAVAFVCVFHSSQSESLTVCIKCIPCMLYSNENTALDYSIPIESRQKYIIINCLIFCSALCIFLTFYPSIRIILFLKQCLFCCQQQQAWQKRSKHKRKPQS